MKQLISVVALGLAMVAGSVYAADAKAPTAQQGKMKTCNADAKTKDLERRRAQSLHERAA